MACSLCQDGTCTPNCTNLHDSLFKDMIDRFKRMVIACEPGKTFPIEGNFREKQELIDKRKRMIEQLPEYECEYEDMKARFKRIQDDNANLEATCEEAIADFKIYKDYNADAEAKYEEMQTSFKNLKDHNAVVKAKYQEMVECAKNLINRLKEVAADADDF